jgi:membrane protein implicated in regulation of membrane protease activity
MRKLDVILIGVGIFLAGGGAYFALQAFGLDSTNAGIWSQAVLVTGILVWSLTYLFRVSTGNMTYQQQLKNYEEAVLQKRLEELTPEELTQIQAEIQQEKLEQEKLEQEKLGAADQP